MNLTASPARRLFRSALVTLVLLVAAAVNVRAENAVTPPAFRDASHVPNGCYLSTTAFIARFAAEFPAERAVPVAMAPRGFGGLHTITLLTWGGNWWGRDEYFGVFALNRSVAGNPDPAALILRAERLLTKLAVSEVKAGRGSYAPAVPAKLPARELATLVRAAAAALPLANEVLWVHGGAEAIPFLLFRPAAGVVAVYHPLHGTATAETTLTESETIVGLVAAKFGYAVAAVRADTTFATGALVAANLNVTR
jgi:hypothetical protein